ncbi:MAG: hypothetical protein ABR867_05780 [Nitrososphaerales archaeon]|jgi:hypothetical protein
MQGNSSVIATIAVGVILICAVAYGIYSSNSGLSALSEQNTSLKGQVAGLSQQVVAVNEQESAMSSQNSNLGNQVAGLNQQVSTLNQQVSILQQKTVQVVTVSNTIVYVQTTSVYVTTTVTSVTAVPTSSLVIIADTYSNATKTFTFQVQNTQNYTVYAQISASLQGQTNWGCGGQAGSYISQVYTFAPNSNTTTKMDLTLGQYAGFCGTNPVTSASVTFVVPQSTAASPTYTFNIVPNYNHP